MQHWLWQSPPLPLRHLRYLYVSNGGDR